MASNESAAGRLLLTLACLVIIPMAAVFGTWLPDLVHQLSQVPWGMAPAVARELFGPATSEPGLSEAPPWGRTNSSTVAPPTRAVHGEAAVAAAGLVGGNQVPGGVACSRGPTYPTNGSVLGGTPVAGSFAAQSRQGAQVNAPLGSHVPAGAVPPTSDPNDSPSPLWPPPQGALSAGVPALIQAEGTGASSDMFVAIQSRLQQLGAVYYLLETWGSDPACYRFYARMAVAGNRNVTRHFEAVDRIPIRAMQRVLENVERWKAAEQEPFGSPGPSEAGQITAMARPGACQSP